MIDKKTLSERDICTKFITPAIEKSGWDTMTQLLEEVYFTDGKIYVRGKMTARGTAKRADYILYYKPNIPIAIVEAKDNNHSVRAGIQQALDYATILDIPCVFSSNGDGFLFHDRSTTDSNLETEISLDDFPSPEQLWEKYKKYKGITTPDAEKIASQDYYFDGTNRKPRYYQQIAINRTVEAIANGQNRILLVMATGTGKTYTAFQIIHRLWKSGTKKRILFLADRNSLIDQTRRGDFKHFKDKMTTVKHRMVDKSYEIYLALYQGLTGNDDEKNIYKQFTPDFFDLIIVDECHRGSAREDSSWRDILQYFSNATQIGLTATPRETNTISNIEYFKEPIYTYSLKQGIDDGFLAPYRVVRIGLNIDLEGWRPEEGKLDKDGNPIEDRIYNRKDFEKTIVIDERTDTVAKKLTEFLKGYDRYRKTTRQHCMNLVEVFNSLEVPDTSNRNLFNAITLADFPIVKVATNNEGLPVILISSVADTTFISQKNIRLKYLELTHNLECKISENNNTQFQNFTVIIFRSNQESLQQYFLGIAETLIKSLSAKPTQQEVFQTFKDFVEIFRTLSDTPTKTLQGLWAELFIIDTAKEPTTLLNYWHSIPEEKFDFNADTEKLEVKSSSTLERIHTFASEQLNPPEDKQVLIASLFVKQTAHGQSISLLANSIQQKVADNHLTEKLFTIISKTLGNTVEQSIKIKFDYDLAKNSLRFYKHQDIHKIEKIYIPHKVSEVRYKSDLTELTAINPQSIPSERLFSAV